MRAVAAAAAVSLALVAAYLALGGASYAPAKVADPCASRDWRDPGGLSEVAEQIVLSALDGAACELGASREDVVLAFDSRDELERFAREHGIDDDELEEVVRSGLLRAIDDAEQADALAPRNRGRLRVSSVASPSRSLLGLLPALEKDHPFMTDIWADWLRTRRTGGDPEYERRMLEELATVRDKVLDNAGLASGETLLDVGCGNGLIAFGALERGANVVFADVSRALLDDCRQLAADAGIADRCRFVEATATELDEIEDESIDVVTTRSVLIYVKDKERAFAEFHRVLRPGGRISLFEPINRFGMAERRETGATTSTVCAT